MNNTILNLKNYIERNNSNIIVGIKTNLENSDEITGIYDNNGDNSLKILSLSVHHNDGYIYFSNIKRHDDSKKYDKL